jgi:hypothetical protein
MIGLDLLEFLHCLLERLRRQSFWLASVKPGPAKMTLIIAGLPASS